MRNAHAGEQRIGPLAHAAMIHDAEAARLPTKEEVFGNGHAGEQHQLLEHRPGANAMGLLGSGQPDFAAFETYDAGVGVQAAAQGLDHGALAGAVFAYQGVNFARRGGEGRVVESTHAAK